MDSKTCLSLVRDIFSTNHFVQLCGIVIDEVGCGTARLHMPIVAEKHTNLSGNVHGGALSTLANTAVGVACCAAGCWVVTQSITTNFIKNITAGHTATCEARIKHCGRTTVTVVAEIFDDEHRLMCETLATMFIKGHSDDIPSEW